jgi:Mrp family chromosome partitioning ATPase
MGGILESLRANFDAVLIDTPPVLPVTDAVILAPRCDGVLLVYYVSVAPREALYRAKVQVESVGGEVVGVVLNDILSQARLEYGYYYYYHHRYAGAEERVRI